MNTAITNRLMIVLVLLINIGFHDFSITAQNMDYARKVLDTLCTPDMHGRGYVKSGNKIAAYYIANEFKKLGVEPLNDSYFQSFAVNVQTFPEAMSVQLNRLTLKAGEDFIVDPSSQGVKGKFKVVRISEEELLDDTRYEELLRKKFRKKALLFDYSPEHAKALRGKLALLKSQVDAALFINLAPKKLTWHISGRPNYYSEITILKDRLPEKFKYIKVNIDSEYLTDYQTQNVIGYIPGTEHPDKYYVFTAHYDHIGRLGADQYIPGANDNASGTTMLLNLGEYYAQNPPKYSIILLACGAEELGLLGSTYFTQNPLITLENIQFVINVDLVGTGDEGITVVNATEFPEAFDLMQDINQDQNYLVEVKERGKAANSDHYPFFQEGVPSFFIYARGGIQAYHDIYDKAETLPLTEFADIMHLVTDFIEQHPYLNYAPIIDSAVEVLDE